MSKIKKSSQESTMSEVPEEETGENYLTYTNNGTINVTVSGNNNVITFMAGQPSPPPRPPGGGQ